MPTLTLNGNEAFAHGALEAGVQIVTSYPGSPSTGAVEVLIPMTAEHDVYIEWSANEKIALEMGIGASLAGKRALVCVKSVGMNALVDPLMVVNVTGVHAGLVILLGDDPGAYGSQNDQDTRPIATFAELPLLEPSTPEEAKAMMIEAFELSERHGTVVIVRETRSFSLKTADVDCADARPPPKTLPMNREPYRWVSYPGNSVELHGKLHAKLEKLRGWANDARWNESRGADQGRYGVIGVGFAFSKLLDVVGENNMDLRLYKLGTLYPAPDRSLAEFMRDCDAVLVLEENEPYIETQLKGIAHDHALTTQIHGKLSGHVSREGELFRWQIQKALEQFDAPFSPIKEYTQSEEAAERPSKKSYCAGCPYLEIVETLKDVGEKLGQRPILTGDPGCLVRASGLLDAKYAMGGATALAQGMVRASVAERVVALFGDSAFFHTAIPAVVNAVYNRTPILMVVLDNSATVTSGFQPNPGSGYDLRGREAPQLSIEKISRACGVEFVRTVGPDDGEDVLRQAFHDGLLHGELGLIVVRKPCEEV